MSFSDDIDRFLLKLESREAALLPAVASAVQDSIVNGSPVTGAPGQPVDTGALRASWSLDFPSATEARISTKIEYAPIIEHNLRGAKLRSQVGGFHSVALTRAGFQKLVDAEVRRMKAGE